MLGILIASLFLLPLVCALIIAGRHTAGPNREHAEPWPPATAGWTALDDLELGLLLGDPSED